MTEISSYEKLLAKFDAWGIQPKTPFLLLDGKIQRVATKTSALGWYIGEQTNTLLWCVFSCSDDRVQLHTNDACIYDKRFKTEDASDKFIEQMKAIERRLTNDEVAKKATRHMATCTPAESNHPYLQAKSILPQGSFQDVSGNLVVPIRTRKGELRAWQTITPLGDTEILQGAQQGCTHVIWGERDFQYLCEDFASGASIAEATGDMTVVCFDAKNMYTVAKQGNCSRFIACISADNLDIGRTMLAEGLVADVVIPRCSGTTFNDMHQEHGLKAVSDSIKSVPDLLTVEDIESGKKISSLNLTTPMLDPGGLISLGMEACANADVAQIPAYNFPLVLVLIARAISGIIRINSLWPSLYMIKVGGTSTGKTDADSFFINAIAPKIPGFFGPTDFASGAGLMRGLVEHPQCVIVLDEVTQLFKRYSGADKVIDDKLNTLLTLYTMSGRTFEKPYGDSKKNFRIENPCINLIGNATPLIFKEIRPQDCESGLLQRLTFWNYNGKIPYRTVSFSDRVESNPPLQKFIAGLQRLMDNKDKLSPLLTESNEAMQVVITDEAKELLQKFSHSVTDNANAASHPGTTGVASRQFHEAQKYALIHLASRCEGELLTTPLDVQDIDYGIKISGELSRWKSAHLLGSGLVHGDFHRDCNVVVAAAVACQVANIAPTVPNMSRKMPQLKELRPKYLQDTLQACIDQERLVLEVSGKLPKYRATRNAY